MHILQRETGRDRRAQRPLAVNVVGLKSRTVGFNQESTNLVVFVFHFRPDDGHVGDAAGSDPHLLAVDHVFVADLFGAGAHAAGVRTEVGFGQAEAAELFAFLHRWQPGLLLFFAAEFLNWIHAQRRLHAYKAADARVAALEFLRQQAVLHIAHTGTAVTF